MEVKRLALILTSENPTMLLEFYRDTIGLPEVFDSGPGGGLEGGAVRVGDASLVIEAHSETRGPATEPHRHLLDLHVDDVHVQQERLRELGVHFIRPATKEDFGGFVATFLDPDGNYVQLVQDA